MVAPGGATEMRSTTPASYSERTGWRSSGASKWRISYCYVPVALHVPSARKCAVARRAAWCMSADTPSLLGNCAARKTLPNRQAASGVSCCGLLRCVGYRAAVVEREIRVNAGFGQEPSSSAGSPHGAECTLHREAMRDGPARADSEGCDRQTYFVLLHVLRGAFRASLPFCVRAGKEWRWCMNNVHGREREREYL
jgi:hypothetical protein